MAKSQRDGAERGLAKGRGASLRQGVGGPPWEEASANESGNTTVLGASTAGKAVLLLHGSTLPIVKAMRRSAVRPGTVGDPRMHVHCVIPNLAREPDNG